MRVTRALTRIFLQGAVFASIGCAGNRHATPGSSASDGVNARMTGAGGILATPNDTTAITLTSGGRLAADSGSVTATAGQAPCCGGTATGGTRTSSAESNSSGATKAVGDSSTTVAVGGQATGGTNEPAGTNSTGGIRASGGFATGQTEASGGSNSRDGTQASGGTLMGGATSIGGNVATGGANPTSCEFTIISKATSSAIATVAIVEWATTLAAVSNAKIVYSLDGAASDVINKGGIAPVDLAQPNYRTLLLGLKQSSSYTFRIEATAPNGTKCTSRDETVTTGTLPTAPIVARTTTVASAQAGGFIVTSSGQNGPGVAYIVDADGSVVWSAAGPNQCTRAHMDYEGQNMWMLALNVSNGVGEMRYVSMDGQTSHNDVTGMTKTHHDFTVLPGGIVAAMSWLGSGSDPESELLERSPDGTVRSMFRIGPNLYAGGPSAMGGSASSFHGNYIVYHSADDTYTISDRNPSLVVKASRTGTPIWQIGGSCTNAPAPKCASGTWRINHGHDFDPNGNMLLFNNCQAGAAHVFEFELTDADTFGITTVKDYNTNGTSDSLGDVQRLPNGNTLITISSAGQILEVDRSWNTVQTLKANVGYAGWRETLYGPPTRK